MKRNLLYGGKSGILPKVRPVFKKNPIRPKNKKELAEDAKIEQGYAEGVPLPKKAGYKFYRKLEDKPVITVEERIKRNIEERSPNNIDETKLSSQEVWELKRDEIRRAHLKEAYLKEADRLKKLDELKEKKAAKSSREEKEKSTFEETEASKLTLPTIESYLKQPIMRQRTSEETDILKSERKLNRKLDALKLEETKADQLLELYYSASNFITTEEELEVAIKDAFEVNVGKFDTTQLHIEYKLSGYKNAMVDIGANEDLVLDAAYGEIKGQPGLKVARDTIDGQIERLKREAQISINEKQN